MIKLDKLNESVGYIQVDEIEELMPVYKSCSYFIPGYQFMPKFKQGWFDGQIHLINLKTKTFPLGLTKHIYDFCNNAGIELQISDEIKTSFVEYINDKDVLDFLQNIRFFSKGIEIYPRQDQLEATVRAIKTKRCINICPTSFGKSLAITMECLWYLQRGFKCLIVVPTKDLVEQFNNDIKDYATNEKGIVQKWYPNVQVIYAGKDKELYPNTDILISTWQSLVKIDDPYFMNQFDSIILDECFDGDSMVLTAIPNEDKDSLFRLKNVEYKPIKDIKAGEYVLNYSETDNKIKLDMVEEVYINLLYTSKEHMYELVFREGYEHIRCTGNHKFLTTKGYKRADELTSEDEVKCHLYNGIAHLLSRKRVPRPKKTYNLRIKNDHNYIVNNMIVSNCHKGQGNCIQQLMMSATECKYRTGWTGTLANSEINELLVKGLFGDAKQIITTVELMEKEIVAQLTILITKLTYPVDVSKEYVEYDYHGQTKMVEACIQRTKKLLSFVGTLESTGLLFYKHIKHGEQIFDMARKMFPARNCYLIHSGHFQMNDTKYKSFEEIKPLIEKDKDGIVIANYQLAGTGISIKNLHFLMFFAPTKSYITTLQSIGRGLRISENKQKVLLVDVVDDFSVKKKRSIKNNYFVKHFEERFQMYCEQKFNYKLLNFNLNVSLADIEEDVQMLEDI